MAKKTTARGVGTAITDEVERLIATIASGQRSGMVILIVPSHDLRQQKLTDQDRWSNAALDLFAELYNGATAFRAAAGIYRTDEGQILRDEPILIESYARDDMIQDPGRLERLLEFMKRMGRDTRQDAVAVIFNDIFHLVRDFS